MRAGSTRAPSRACDHQPSEQDGPPVLVRRRRPAGPAPLGPAVETRTARPVQGARADRARGRRCRPVREGPRRCAGRGRRSAREVVRRRPPGLARRRRQPRGRLGPASERQRQAMRNHAARSRADGGAGAPRRLVRRHGRRSHGRGRGPRRRAGAHRPGRRRDLRGRAARPAAASGSAHDAAGALRGEGRARGLPATRVTAQVVHPARIGEPLDTGAATSRAVPPADVAAAPVALMTADARGHGRGAGARRGVDEVGGTQRRARPSTAPHVPVPPVRTRRDLPAAAGAATSRTHGTDQLQSPHRRRLRCHRDGAARAGRHGVRDRPERGARRGPAGGARAVRRAARKATGATGRRSQRRARWRARARGRAAAPHRVPRGRAWADADGVTVRARGRVRADVLERYRAASSQLAPRSGRCRPVPMRDGRPGAGVRRRR